MKQKLIIAGILIILFFLVILFASLWAKQKKETKQQKNNFEVELLQKLDEQQEISTKQFKELFEKEVAVLKEHGISPRQVENVINIAYRFIDTLIPQYQLVFIYDTIKEYEVADFDIQSECSRIQGSVFKDTIEITSIETTDSILISLYKEKRKCLFERRTVKAIAISQCKGYTVEVLRNLKIGR